MSCASRQNIWAAAASAKSSIAFSVLSENPTIRRDENKFATIVSTSPRRSKPGLSTEGEANALAKAEGTGARHSTLPQFAVFRRTFDIAADSVHAGPQASKHQTLSRLEVIASPITLWQ